MPVKGTEGIVFAVFAETLRLCAKPSFWVVELTVRAKTQSFRKDRKENRKQFRD
jgi:hypothetical protein